MRRGGNQRLLSRDLARRTATPNSGRRTNISKSRASLRRGTVVMTRGNVGGLEDLSPFFRPVPPGVCTENVIRFD
jgi:hypothetical protein